MKRVYVSLPLCGPSAVAGREVLLGAELAHAQHGGSVELVPLDSFSADRDEQALSNARRAAEDDAALAYIGDFHSSQVLVTAPVLGEAGLLQVAPVATFVGLHGSTLVRLMPNDEAGARAIAAWLAHEGVRSVLVVHDHDEGYGKPVGAMCADAATGRGLAVRIQPVWKTFPSAQIWPMQRPSSTRVSAGRALLLSGSGCMNSTRLSGLSERTASPSPTSPVS